MDSSLKKRLIDLKGGCCKLCGYNRCFSALHFHHVNPFEKSFTISDKSRLDSDLKEELDKCILLCSNCHSEVHAGLIDIEHLADILDNE